MSEEENNNNINIIEQINLENCDFTSKGKRINSPHSIEALNLIGVRPNEINKISYEKYISIHPECRKLPKEFIEERYNAFNKEREDIIKEAKQIRNQLIEEDIKNNGYYIQNEEIDIKNEKSKLNNNEEEKKNEDEKKEEEKKEDEKKEENEKENEKKE